MIPVLSRLVRRCVAWVVLACVLTGCHPSGPPLLPVSGKVMKGGQPLSGGAVSFVPDASKGNSYHEAPVGMIQSDGTYQLTTNGKPGAPPGWYKVTISTMTPPGPGDTAPMQMSGNAPRLNTKYSSPTLTDLTAEVTDNPGRGAYDFNLAK
jgi:hypothetical protein